MYVQVLIYRATAAFSLASDQGNRDTKATGIAREWSTRPLRLLVSPRNRHASQKNDFGGTSANCIANEYCSKLLRLKE